MASHRTSVAKGKNLWSITAIVLNPQIIWRPPLPFWLLPGFWSSVRSGFSIAHNVSSNLIFDRQFLVGINGSFLIYRNFRKRKRICNNLLCQDAWSISGLYSICLFVSPWLNLVLDKLWDWPWPLEVTDFGRCLFTFAYSTWTQALSGDYSLEQNGHKKQGCTIK